MVWSREKCQEISELFEADDVEQFRRAIEAHPEQLRSEEGTDMWMWQAAMEGKLDFVKTLVELGMDVNETQFPPGHRSHDPEGAILQAAGSGQLEVVRWMLDHGAKINFVVKGTPRCQPLVAAATGGFLDVVKLLIEHGADVHATWNNVNAVTQADLYGKTEVRDYLSSLGAKDLRETTPPDYPAGHQRMLELMTKRRGPLGDWSETIPGDPSVTLHYIPANSKYEAGTVFTVGLSDRNLIGEYSLFCAAELRFTLPADWTVTPESVQDPRRSWPFEGLKRVMREWLSSGRLPEPPAILKNGDPPTPLVEGSELCAWMCLTSDDDGFDLPDHRVISVHDLIPIYPEELALLDEYSERWLVHLAQERDIPLDVDPQRPNLAVGGED